MTNQNANDPTKEIRNVLSQMVQRKYEAPIDGYQTSAPPISNANLEYLRGNTSDKDCAKVFEEYQKCLSVCHMPLPPSAISFLDHAADQL